MGPNHDWGTTKVWGNGSWVLAILVLTDLKWSYLLNSSIILCYCYFFCSILAKAWEIMSSVWIISTRNAEIFLRISSWTRGGLRVIWWRRYPMGSVHFFFLCFCDYAFMLLFLRSDEITFDLFFPFIVLACKTSSECSSIRKRWRSPIWQSPTRLDRIK
jgi:hypothetical protein